jgi:hypothetical protein
VAGIRIDQRSLDHVSAAWQFGHDALGLGLRYECPEGSIVEPVLIDRKVRALIYLDRVSEECPEDQFALVKSLIARRCGEDAAAPLPTPAFDQREHLLLMLERNEWNIARAARLLGVSRLTVYRRLRRLGLARPEEGSDQALVLAPASSRN